MKDLFNLNPCLLCAIVICTTILVLSIVALLAYRIYKARTCTLGGYIFQASVLLVFAITIFSYCFCKDRNVLDFISLASALISIVLAIVTIIYSYFTNSRTSGQIEQLNKAAEDVSTATGAYSQSASELKNNIVRIIQAVDVVNQKTDKIYAGMVKPITNVSHRDNAETASNGISINLEDVFQKSAPLEIIVLYTCIKSKKAQRPWKADMLLPDLHGVLGVVITLHSVGLINVEVNYENVFITVQDYNHELEKYVARYIEMVRKDEELEGVAELLQRIDTYFSEL